MDHPTVVAYWDMHYYEYSGWLARLFPLVYIHTRNNNSGVELVDVSIVKQNAIE